MVPKPRRDKNGHIILTRSIHESRTFFEKRKKQYDESNARFDAAMARLDAAKIPQPEDTVFK